MRREFGLEHSLHNPPHVNARGVIANVDEPSFARLAQPGLLLLNHHFVFIESSADLLEELFRRLWFVLAISICC